MSLDRDTVVEFFLSPLYWDGSRYIWTSANKTKSICMAGYHVCNLDSTFGFYCLLFHCLFQLCLFCHDAQAPPFNVYAVAVNMLVFTQQHLCAWTAFYSHVNRKYNVTFSFLTSIFNIFYSFMLSTHSFLHQSGDSNQRSSGSASKTLRVPLPHKSVPDPHSS